MHRPLFVVSSRDVNSRYHYVPTEDDVWEQVKDTYDCIGLANEDEWTEESFVSVLNGMFDGVVYDGKMYIIPVKAIEAYLEGMAERIRKHIAEEPLTGETICRWKNRLRFGI